MSVIPAISNRLPAHFRLKTRPVARPEAVINTAQARFTVLTSRLLRLEHQADGQFEDRPSQAIWYREQPVPSFTHSITPDGQVRLETEHLLLQYTPQAGAGFTGDTLSITLKGLASTWTPALEDPHNLKGTVRTLDDWDGPQSIRGNSPLPDGLMSRAGWSVLDDSKALVFEEDGWLAVREAAGQDWYFFGYGIDYQATLDAYCQITGHTPLLPRYALGNWWSRYWAFSQPELIQLIEDFKAQDIPLSVCVIDMDWHITKTGNTSIGWTGYTWNRELFPDPPALIQYLHDQGLKTSLNVHPHEGVHPHEAAYEQMAVRLESDPASQQPIKFDMADPRYVNGYFELLHHPHEAIGIDFWWIDWQQGETTQLAGLDPLWWLNHLHSYDLPRDNQRRTFLFSRWGGYGNHRYPIGFSGDTWISWASLAFQPYFTATAANVAYGWWSHDIGGHQVGTEDGELYTRWVQWGTFSPISRIHVTKNPFQDRRPWWFRDAEVLRVSRDAFQLRHALIPYLYTMARLNETENLMIVRPMYYLHPTREEAYHCPQQYAFGTELIVAPFTSPRDPQTGLSRQVVWLPDGDWYHFFTGEAHTGGWHAQYGRLEDIPVFAPAGAIVPLTTQRGWGQGLDNPTELDVMVFAGADRTFTLYEDDGVTPHYLQGAYALTTLEQRFQAKQLDFAIAPIHGQADLVPSQRTWHIYVRGVKADVGVTVEVDGTAHTVNSHYDLPTETLIIDVVDIPVQQGIGIRLTHAENVLSRRDRRADNLFDMLRTFRLPVAEKDQVWQVSKVDATLDNPTNWGRVAMTLHEHQLRAILEVQQQVGYHRIDCTQEAPRYVLWNNHAVAVNYRFASQSPIFWQGPHYDWESGIIPRFHVVKPLADPPIHAALWELYVNYWDVLTLREGKWRSTLPAWH